MSAYRDSRRLRLVLGVNAVVSGMAGLLVAVAAPIIDSLLGTGTPVVVRIVGSALVVFAVGVYLVSRAEGSLFEKGVLEITILDFGWVIASVATVVAGWFSPLGNALVLAVAIVVGTFGALELSGLRQIRSAPRAS